MNIKKSSTFCDECKSYNDVKTISTRITDIDLCKECRIELAYLLLQELREEYKEKED